MGERTSYNNFLCTMTHIDEFDAVVVGGGIAGVTCVESLLLLEPALKIALISATPCVKSTCNVVALGRIMEKFDVIEQDRSEFQERFPSVKFIHGEASRFDSISKELYFLAQAGDSSDHGILKYKKLCICAGGVPNMVLPESSLGRSKFLGRLNIQKFGPSRNVCRRLNLALVGQTYCCTPFAEIRYEHHFH